MSDVYWNAARPAVRRAMSLQDANPASATYGCCDRDFWQYRTISSFPAGTMQQLALPFAVLFDAPFPGNEWHRRDEMLARARAAMLFWARAQHRSGAVDEWYRNEHSYCATAFTAFGMAEACLRVRAHLTPADAEEIQGALVRAAGWLGERFNDDVMNQNLAAAAALWSIHRLTGDPRCRAAYDRTWGRTLTHQDEEGWFVEYGGADLGYSLLALDLLAALHQRACSDAAPVAASLSRFVAAFAVGGGDLAGRLGSRGTEHAFPFGVEAFATTIPSCRTIAGHLRHAIGRQSVNDPGTADDRYLAYFYLPSFVLAASVDHAADAAGTQAPPAPAVFGRSGFRVWTRPGSALVTSARRNAAFNLCAEDGSVHRNLGYWIETTDALRFASCGWSAEAIRLEEREDGLEVDGVFVRVADTLPLVRHEVAFRAATNWVFAWPGIAEPFHRFIKRRKIARRVVAPFRFSRELTWNAQRLVVRDRIRAEAGAPAVRMVIPTADIEVHSPSARASGASPSHAIVVSPEVAAGWAARLNANARIDLVATYATEGGALRFTGIEEDRGMGSAPAVPAGVPQGQLRG